MQEIFSSIFAGVLLYIIAFFFFFLSVFFFFLKYTSDHDDTYRVNKNITTKKEIINMKTPEKKLKVAWLVLTYGCNNSCQFCYAQSMIHDFRQQGDTWSMPFDFACQTVKELKSLGVNSFHLIGGEPTIYPHLFDLIRYIKQDRKTHVALITNGKRMSDESYVAELLALGVNGIQISLQGPDAKTHNTITGSESFNLSYAALANLAKAKFPQFCVAITVGKYNRDQIDDFIHTMKREIFRGGHRGKIFINFATPSINLKSPDSINGEYALDPREVVEFIQSVHERFPISTHPEIEFSNRVPLCLYPEPLLKQLKKTKRINDGCACGVHYQSIIAIDPRGDILPCTHFAGTRLFNCKTDTNFDRGKFIQGIDQQYPLVSELTRSYPTKKCKGCKEFYRCFGGCLFWWLYFDPQQIINQKKPTL